MQNPFESLEVRLANLEGKIDRLLIQQPIATHTAEVGGIELAQEVTRLSKPRLYALVSARGIPHAKRGNKLYFNRTELLNWVAAGKRGEATQQKR